MCCLHYASSTALLCCGSRCLGLWRFVGSQNGSKSRNGIDTRNPAGVRRMQPGREGQIAKLLNPIVTSFSLPTQTRQLLCRDDFIGKNPANSFVKLAKAR